METKNRFCIFSAGDDGDFSIQNIKSIIGPEWPPARKISILTEDKINPQEKWNLKGIASHGRYTERSEKIKLDNQQEGLGRPEATCCVLIPIKKSDDWWLLTQDERRRIFEEKSKHISGSMKYLPQIARKLYHSRDLPGQYFDFLTYFEFAPTYKENFEELLVFLRSSEEWKYIIHEVDIRFTRE